jgi:hypothetical protein
VWVAIEKSCRTIPFAFIGRFDVFSLALRLHNPRTTGKRKNLARHAKAGNLMVVTFWITGK